MLGSENQRHARTIVGNLVSELLVVVPEINANNNVLGTTDFHLQLFFGEISIKIISVTCFFSK